MNLAVIFLSFAAFATQANAEISHGFSVFSKLKYHKDFTHFDYVNPDAPKGGTLVYGALGTFDSLNPYIVMGNPVPWVMIFCAARLMDEPHDRAGEVYGYVAESIDVSDDYRSVTFHLRPNITFSNGEPITVEDIIWSFEQLREKGRPLYRTYYKNVSAVEKVTSNSIKFSFDTAQNRELPLILGQIPVLNKKFYETVSFDKTTLNIAPSSGPYVVESLEQGRSITFKRVENWWGASLPSQRGQFNFDRIRFDYYLDSNALFEAFKAGKTDVYVETSIKNWMTAYVFPAVVEGKIKKAEISHGLSTGTFGFFFNTRRPIFQNLQVRQALSTAFDFFWVNKNIFYSQYIRNKSFYPNSDFAAIGLPSPEEVAILERYREKIPADVLSKEIDFSEFKTESEKRQILILAKQMLEESGWFVEQGKLVNKTTGKPFVFEILLSNKAYEKVVLNYVQNLAQLGITAKVRLVDDATYQRRIEDKDFDMILSIFAQSPSLGNEQRDFFGSERADIPGSLNYAGIKNPVIDQLIEHLIQSSTYHDLVARSRALDRVLIFNHYMIPAWHSNATKVAYWDKFDQPKIAPKYHPFYYLSWWMSAKKQDSNQTKKTEQESVQKKSLWDSVKTWMK